MRRRTEQQRQQLAFVVRDTTIIIIIYLQQETLALRGITALYDHPTRSHTRTHMNERTNGQRNTRRLTSYIYNSYCFTGMLNCITTTCITQAKMPTTLSSVNVHHFKNKIVPSSNIDLVLLTSF